MPAVLHLKTEEIDTPEKRGNYTVSVIGCGRRGVLYALAFAEAGFKVICTDADQSVVKRLSRKNPPLADREVETRLRSLVGAGRLSATSELKTAVSQSDIIIITVSPKIDAKKNLDYLDIESICKQVGTALLRESLVVYAGVAGFGLTEGVVKETLENASGYKAGEDFGLAYSPIRSAATRETKLGDRELGVAARDKFSLDSATLVFETIAKKGVKRISDVRMAELAALFASAKRDVNVALANELAVFCENAGLDYVEMLKLIDNDACEISPIPTIAEENDRNEAYSLLETADNLNVKLRLSALARQVNEDMVRHAVNLTQEALRINDRTLRRAKVALLGAIKSGTAAAKLAEALEAKGAKVRLYDVRGSGNEQTDSPRTFARTLNEAVEGTDCVVVLTEKEQLERLNLKKLKAIMRPQAALIDLAGIVEPDKAEEEGFTYRGLGRGVWKR